MVCDKCRAPTGTRYGGLCNYCAYEGRWAKLLWRLAPAFMRRRRWKQNLRKGGWL
jgi:hypothetical protein